MTYVQIVLINIDNMSISAFNMIKLNQTLASASKFLWLSAFSSMVGLLSCLISSSRKVDLLSLLIKGTIFLSTM